MDIFDVEMVPIDEVDNSAQCTVFDMTPDSEQKKINIVVRPYYTVGKVMSDITTQYRYDSFDLVLQPLLEGDLVYLNEYQSSFIYDLPGFLPDTKNTLILFPSGKWDGNIKNRFDFSPSSKTITNGSNSGVHTFGNDYKYINNNGNIADKNTTTTIGSETTSKLNSVSIHTTISSNIPITESLNVSPYSDTDQLSDDDLALGASASPTELSPTSNGLLELAQTSPHSVRGRFETMGGDDPYQQMSSEIQAEQPFDNVAEKCAYWNTTPHLSTVPSTAVPSQNLHTGYVGLVNQAMTCYLNSLLQALFMTPEFRNALYRWKFDNDNEAKNIPYQLQKIFLRLQTSTKHAVETTDLTRSFGWDSNEAWQQHDVQELCRVMFDALEQKFKNTKQKNLISNLYEGKMIDYVKCLECNTVKSREDTFLDIPLPVRPFGRTEPYESIEEALHAFVQPETLDGNNQYFCEKCNKMCNAHKGLKFKSFPYVLTLHLKRFDFDYQTMHRIKLNDKVTFPQKLNLNDLLYGESGLSLQVNGANSSSITNGYALNGIHGGVQNTDDCSTTDSGSAMEEDNCSIIAAGGSSSQHDTDMNDDDEGIDVSTSTDHRANASVDEPLNYNSGLYELFAIMIHAGSASGGHYYAYIKEFDNDEWFCFNDQSVSPITDDDIKKSFGGNVNPSKPYYTSLFNSSTNAYMLMYRQIDVKRNERVMRAADFPTHIHTLLGTLVNEEQMANNRVGHHNAVSNLSLPELIKPRVYFYNPLLKKIKVTRVYLPGNFDVNVVLESAYQQHNIEEFAPMSDCRLVAYSHTSKEIIQSFESVNDPTLADLRASCEGTFDFLLEYRLHNQEFEEYKAGGCTWYVYIVNLVTMGIDGPYLVFSMAHKCNLQLRHSIAVRLNVNENEFLLATLPGKKSFVAYDPNPSNEANETLRVIAKTHFQNLSYIYLNVPLTDPVSLELQGIPIYDQTPAIEVSSSDVVDAVLMNDAANASQSGDMVTHSNTGYLTVNCRESPISTSGGATASQESNSEDSSSLSDGDRTLVESTQNRGGGDSQISSNSHSPQLSSPEEESARESLNRVQAFLDFASPHNDNEYSTHEYFHATKVESGELNIQSTLSAQSQSANKASYYYKIIMDSHMKMEVFKQHIQCLIHVPTSYFKIQRKYDTTENLTMKFITEGETLTVELGKLLQQDEQKAKIFFLRLSDLSDETGKLECICEWIYNTSMKVLDAKKALVAKLNRISEKYQTLTLENCCLWLKGGRNPIRILADEDKLTNEYQSSAALEFFVQECEVGVNPVYSDDSITIFVRRWYADELKFGEFQELTLKKDSEIRNALATITDIPEKHIAYCKVNTYFPCTGISLLNLNGSMSWFSISALMDQYPLSSTLSGNFYFYKDVTKAPKELTNEERRKLTASEKARLERVGSTFSRYSYHERGLKIHLDTSQTSTSGVNNTTATESMEMLNGAKAGN